MAQAISQVDNRGDLSGSVVHVRAPMSKQYIDEATQIIKEEIKLLCSQITLLLDCAEDEFSESNEFDDKLAEKIVIRLNELSAAMRFARLPVVARLSELLQTIFEQVINSERNLDLAQRAAIFTNCHLLIRYVDFCNERPQADTGLVLSSAFNRLARVRLTPHTLDSYLFESELVLNESIKASKGINMAELGLDLIQLRRGRQMYQVALIALLRGDRAEEAFNMVLRVCEHNQKSSSDLYNKLWTDFARIVTYYQSGQLLLDAQRCFMLTKIDRLLRSAIRQEQLEFNQPLLQQLIKEFELLIQLADQSRIGSDSSLGKFSVSLELTEKTLQKYRAKLENGVEETLKIVCAICEERLCYCRTKLESLAGSIDNQQIINTVRDELSTVYKVIEFNGLEYLEKNLKQVIENFDRWVEHGDAEGLEQFADELVAVEHTANWLSQQSLDDVPEEMLEKPVLQEAQIKLFSEIQSNIALANRALTAYTEDNFQSTHLTNIDRSLKDAANGFGLSECDSMRHLLELCITVIAQQADEKVSEVGLMLETIADCLVTADGMVNELKKTTKSNPLFDTLISDSAKVLESYIKV